MITFTADSYGKIKSKLKKIDDPVTVHVLGR